MARQNGIIKLKGTIDGVSFYKTADGHMARAAGGVDAERIKKDPKFQRTRENNAEFGAATKSMKLLRRTLSAMLKSAGDGRVTSRMIRAMTEIKNFDTTSARGKRSVGLGINDPQAAIKLKDFEFNIHSELGAILLSDYAVDTSTGVIDIMGLVPANDLSFPPEATHVSFKGAFANVNFTTGKRIIKYTNEVNLPLDSTQSNVSLTPTAVATGTGIQIYLLLIVFSQEINGVQYSLKNGSHNAMAIIEVV